MVSIVFEPVALADAPVAMALSGSSRPRAARGWPDSGLPGLRAGARGSSACTCDAGGLVASVLRRAARDRETENRDERRRNEGLHGGGALAAGERRRGRTCENVP